MRYRFGEFELDADAYTLLRGGRELVLQPKVFDLLRLLVERRGQVLTKAELLDALWSGEHVNEGAVPWTIFHARRALGQERGARAPIETVQGRGYRLIANVEVLPADGPVAARAVAALPFVGRGEVMARLEGRLAQALSGEGALCVLAGEAGIGKTRCAEELRGRAAQRGVRIWSGRSVEGLGAPVFWPWIQVLREAVREQPFLAEAGNALLARMGALDAAGAKPDARAKERGADRFWVLDGVSRLLLQASERTGLLVLLEDLQCADAATVELLAFLAPQLARARLLVVGTVRSDSLERDPRRAARLLRGAEQIGLEALTSEDVTRYIAELTRHVPSAQLSRAVHRATAGNPLFLQETLRSLLAEHGGDKLASLAPESVVPSKVARDVLRARLESLDGEALAVLATASVLGESFELAILHRLRGQALEALLQALESAGQGGLIVSDGTHRYRFAHALLRSILYDDMPASERVAAHRRAAELLSELSQGARRHSEIAHHYYQSLAAGDAGRVASAARAAAEAAGQIQAFEDAVTFYRWALEAQALDPAAQASDRADLLYALGSAERLAGRTGDARRTLYKVVEVARRGRLLDLMLRSARALRPTHAVGGVPDPVVRSLLEEALKLAPLGPDPRRISALSQLACVPPYSLDMSQCGALSGEALALARELGDPNWLVEALSARLHALSGPDHTDDLVGAAEELLARGDGPWVRCEAHMARIGAFLHRCDVASADAALRELDRAAREARLPEAIWFHDRIRNQRRILDGEFDAAKTACKELVRRAERIGLGYGEIFAGTQLQTIRLYQRGPDVARSWNLKVLFALDGVQPSYRAGLVALAAELGQTREATRMLDAMAARDFEDVPKDIGYLNALSHLARAAATLRDRPRAERLYELLAPHADFSTPNSMLFHEGSASHALALLAALLGWDERAQGHFERAIAANESMGARPALARATCEYAHWLGSHRGPARARGPALRAATLAQELGMDWVVTSARELI